LIRFSCTNPSPNNFIIIRSVLAPIAVQPHETLSPPLQFSITILPIEAKRSRLYSLSPSAL
jgi:hypothetical protein